MIQLKYLAVNELPVILRKIVADQLEAPYGVAVARFIVAYEAEMKVAQMVAAPYQAKLKEKDPEAEAKMAEYLSTEINIKRLPSDLVDKIKTTLSAQEALILMNLSEAEKPDLKVVPPEGVPEKPDLKVVPVEVLPKGV